jgi:hypothetical protein
LPQLLIKPPHPSAAGPQLTFKSVHVFGTQAPGGGSHGGVPPVTLVSTSGNASACSE